MHGSKIDFQPHTYLNYFLVQYLGPSTGQLIHLFVLFVVNSLTVFALFILLVRSLWSLIFNTTTIESWEIERHETLVRRARVLGGYLEAPDGKRILIKKQEFPYDIGIWSNVKQGMGGSANVSRTRFSDRVSILMVSADPQLALAICSYTRSKFGMGFRSE